MKRLFLIFLLLGCINLDQEEYKILSIINNPENDLEIKLFSNKIASITRTAYGFSFDDLVRVQDAWHFSEKNGSQY